MADKFCEKFITPMPEPRPENYLTYVAEFPRMYRDFMYWASKLGEPIVSAQEFAKAILRRAPNAGSWMKGGKEHVTNIWYNAPDWPKRVPQRRFSDRAISR